MNTVEAALDFFVGYADLIEHPEEIRSHFVDGFCRGRGNAEKTLEMNRSGVLIVSTRVWAAGL
jgi:hypothetical protein